MVDQLPIDIHSTKLLEWLVSRRHATGDWQSKVYTIRHKINNAIQDMPEHKDVVQLLAGTYINYFHALQIVQLLKETEAESKNIFGRYSSQRMKDWQEIIRLYEVDGIYLAEAAQILQRLVAYELPAVKRQIAKSIASVQEAERKEKDYYKQAKDAKRHFNNECTKWQIKGDNIKSELQQLAQHLPTVLNDLASRTKQLDDSVTFYALFRRYVLIMQEEDELPKVLSMLKYVIDNGNTTFYQWSKGKVPLSIQTNDVIDDGKVSDEINFDIDFDVPAGDQNIELDLDSIDFDNGNDIDFDLDNVDISLEHEAESQSDEQVDQIDLDDGIARNNDALGVLEHFETRNMLIADLLEIECFLAGRLLESGDSETGELSLADMLDKKYQKSNDSLKNELVLVKKIRSELCDSQKHHLFKIRASASYLDKLAEEINHKNSLISRAERSAELMKEKQEELKIDGSVLQPQLKLMAQRVREMQKQMEADISKKYKGRPVNIMGEINMALAI